MWTKLPASATLLLPGSQLDRIAEIFFLGRDTAAAFADKLRVPNQMGILVGAVFMHAVAVELA